MTTATTSTTGATATEAVRVGASALLVAALANIAILLVGRAAGADMSVLPAGGTERQEVGVVMVLLTTAVPLLLGTVALAIATRWGARGWNVLAWLGLALGVVTVVMPFGAEPSTGTGLTLASMHLVVGAVWFALVRRSLARS